MNLRPLTIGSRLCATRSGNGRFWLASLGCRSEIGDCKPVGGDVAELGIDSGPGYGAYCWRDGDVVVVALGGGDKSTQQKDIAKAQAMAKELKG